MFIYCLLFLFPQAFPNLKAKNKAQLCYWTENKEEIYKCSDCYGWFSWIWRWIQAAPLYCLYLSFLSFIALSSRRQPGKISARLTTFMTSEPSVPPARRDRSFLELLAASCQLKASLFLRVSGSLVLGERALSCTVSALDSARGDALRWKSHV